MRRSRAMLAMGMIAGFGLVAIVTLSSDSTSPERQHGGASVAHDRAGPLARSKGVGEEAAAGEAEEEEEEDCGVCCLS